MSLKKVLLLALAAATFSSCSQEKKSNGFSGSQQPTAPQQSFIVRTNAQGQAEYAIANFNESTSQQDLAQIAARPQQWQPVGQTQVINQNVGYPNAQDGNFYFVQDPQNFNGQNAPSDTNNARGRGRNWISFSASIDYGYYSYPNYAGSNYGYRHWYPSVGNYAGYFYQPTYYYQNNWQYWNPCFQWGYSGYNYSFYSYPL